MAALRGSYSSRGKGALFELLKPLLAGTGTLAAYAVIAAQTGISGSSTVGDHSILGGQVGIGEHAHLDPNTIIGGQGGVLNGKHVRGGEVLWGTPVRPLKEFLNQQAHLSRLPRWMDEIKRKLFGSDKRIS